MQKMPSMIFEEDQSMEDEQVFGVGDDELKV